MRNAECGTRNRTTGTGTRPATSPRDSAFRTPHFALRRGCAALRAELHRGGHLRPAFAAEALARGGLAALRAELAAIGLRAAVLAGEAHRMRDQILARCRGLVDRLARLLDLVLDLG